MKVRRIFQLLTLAIVLLGLSMTSFAQIGIGIAVNIAPPALPVYEQPICPGANYIWTPGYWAWNGYDYYWVPGTWIVAPSYGLLWTPGYWGWGTGGYFWHTGYWGQHIGFYGGVNYGYGYFGHGFEGGYWRGNSFYYNTAVSRVNTTVIRNVYVNKTVINNVTVNNRVSYNGGRGGIAVRPNGQEQTAYNQRRMGPVGAQETHERVAQQDKANFFKANNGVPAHAALARPAANVNDFNRNAVAAHGARPVEPNNNARPETRPTPTQAQRPNTSGARPEQTARPETRPTPTQAQRPTTPASRPEPVARPESRPAPTQAQRPTTPASRPEPVARPATPNQAQRPVSAPSHSVQASRPSPSPRPEERPQAQSRPAPQSHPESQARPSEPRGEERPH